GAFTTIRNSTFSNNHALDKANGQAGVIQLGGGFNLAGGMMGQNCTFAYNQSYRGGGCFARTSRGGRVNLESTIIYYNTSGSGGVDFNGGVYTAKNCIIYSTSGATSFTDLGGNSFGAAADPLLAPLAYSGGATRTHALQPGSTAIDKGSNPA